MSGYHHCDDCRPARLRPAPLSDAARLAKSIIAMTAELMLSSDPPARAGATNNLCRSLADVHHPFHAVGELPRENATQKSARKPTDNLTFRSISKVTNGTAIQ